MPVCRNSQKVKKGINVQSKKRYCPSSDSAIVLKTFNNNNYAFNRTFDDWINVFIFKFYSDARVKYSATSNRAFSREKKKNNTFRSAKCAKPTGNSVVEPGGTSGVAGIFLSGGETFRGAYFSPSRGFDRGGSLEVFGGGSTATKFF